MLLAGNLSEYCSIDETQICGEVYVFLTSKAGHGMKKTLIASVKGTKAETVSAILLKIPKEEREKVREVTMDFSDSMYSIVKTCFPNATIVIDCFHIVQRLCEALDEMRLRFKRLAVTKTKKEAAEHNQREDEKARKRKYNREWYASHKASKNVKGKKRGKEAHPQTEVQTADILQRRHEGRAVDKGKNHTIQVWREMGQESEDKGKDIVRQL